MVDGAWSIARAGARAGARPGCCMSVMSSMSKMSKMSKMSSMSKMSKMSKMIIGASGHEHLARSSVANYFARVTAFVRSLLVHARWGACVAVFKAVWWLVWSER
jgi:hypothetical protein